MCLGDRVINMRKMRLLAVWVNSDPQTLSVSDECSGETAPDVSVFQSNSNATWLQLRANVSEVGKMFATKSSTNYPYHGCIETTCLKPIA